MKLTLADSNTQLFFSSPIFPLYHYKN